MRILLALERWPSRPALVDPALAVAKAMQAVITTLYVENEALLRYAALPFAREVDPHSGEERRLDPAALERAFRAEAQRAHRALLAAARHHDVPLSFRVARGSMHGVAETAAEEADILVLGLFGAIGRPVSTQSAQRRAVPAPRVLAFYSGGPESARALAMARRVAEASAQPLAVLAPPAQRRSAEALLAEVGALSALGDMASPDLAAFLEVAAREPEATVVLPYSAAGPLAPLRQALPAVRDRLFFVVK
jgi:hypothetical protein